MTWSPVAGCFEVRGADSALWILVLGLGAGIGALRVSAPDLELMSVFAWEEFNSEPETEHGSARPQEAATRGQSRFKQAPREVLQIIDLKMPGSWVAPRVIMCTG